MAYKMKGHSLPGPNQKKSAAKHRITSLDGMDDKGIQSVTSHNDSHAAGKDPHGSSKKSPAKCPLALAAAPMIAGAVGGMMKKKKEE